MKEAGEYTGAHVLSMVRAHYPLIDLKHLEAGYPKEVDLDKAEELRMTQLDLLAKIIGNINLCGGAMPRDHRGSEHMERPVPGGGNGHFASPQPYRPSAYRGRAKDAAARTGR